MKEKKEIKLMQKDYRRIISILDDILNPDSDRDDLIIACARIYGISKSQSFLYSDKESDV